MQLVLKDHTRRKRKLVPPMLEVLGNSYSPYSWAKELVPEFFWISKLMADYGPQTGVETARAFAEAASNSSTTDPKPMFATASSFSKLSQDEQKLLVSNLPRHTRELVQNALNPMAAVWPASPFSF